MTRARVTQIMNLTFLAPDIQEQILFMEPAPDGRDAVSERKVRQIATTPLWADQRRRWAAIVGAGATVAAPPIRPTAFRPSSGARGPLVRRTATPPATLAKPRRRPASPLSSSVTGLPRAPTLERFLDHWLAHVAWNRLRFTTARTYAGVVVRMLGPALGAIRVRALRSDHIEKAGLVWQRAGVKQSMRRKAIEVLRSALGHAVALGLCETNAASRARIPPKGRRAASWLDVDDARKLLESAKGHALETAYALAIGLGLRRGEILGLTWNDVDHKRHELSVRWNRVEWQQGMKLVAPKTAASVRTLAMPAVVERSLRAQRRREDRKARLAGATVRPDDPVLTTRTRRPFWTSYLHVELQTRLRQLGMPPMRFHDLRHTAASLMLADGAAPRTVMEMLGHRNLDVTMLIYGHTNLRHQREAARIMDRALTGRRRK